MDGKRWWIVDEIARWWRTASDESRAVLVQRVLDGAPEATYEEVIEGAIRAEADTGEADEQARAFAERLARR